MNDPKLFTNLQARAALLGAELHSIRNDAERWAYILTAGAITRDFASLDDVDSWLTERAAQRAQQGEVAA